MWNRTCHVDAKFLLDQTRDYIIEIPQILYLENRVDVTRIAKVLQSCSVTIAFPPRHRHFFGVQRL